MSTVNYTIVAFDDMTSEYVVTYNNERINVPAITTDGAVDETKTRQAIETEIKLKVNPPTPSAPSGYVSLVGTTNTVDLSPEEV